MLIYNYDSKTKEFLSKKEADKDPEESKIKGVFVPLVPKNATLIEPPEYGENQTAVFNNGAWVIEADYRSNYKKVCVSQSGAGASDELGTAQLLNFAVTDIVEIGELEEGYYLVDNETAKLIEKTPDNFKIENNEIVQKTDDEIEAEEAEKEKEKIAQMSLTAADVERAIYKSKGMDFDDIISFIESQGADIDIKALKIELKANNFYRGNEYISKIGALLGFTEKQLDNFFNTNDYTKLTESEE